MQGIVIIHIVLPSGITYYKFVGNLVVDATRARLVDAILHRSSVGLIDEIRVGYMEEGVQVAGNDDTAMEDQSYVSLSIDSQTTENNGMTIKSISETKTITGASFTFNELGLFQEGGMFSHITMETAQSVPVDSQYTIEWKITF